jgi:hypothetical protein
LLGSDETKSRWLLWPLAFRANVFKHLSHVMLADTLVAPRLQAVPACPVPTEVSAGPKVFTPATPSSAFRADLALLHTATPLPMCNVTAPMRECDIVHQPEQFDANAFPRLLMINTQFINGLDLLTATKADILTMFLQ